MSGISPKPNIRQVVRTWNVQPGMIFAVAEDTEGRLWIEESCPVGTHYWTVEQAAELLPGYSTRRALEEAVALGRDRQLLDRLPTLPLFDAELETAISAAPSRLHRTGVSGRNLARV
jgi:hypothetical protein